MQQRGKLFERLLISKDRSARSRIHVRDELGLQICPLCPYTISLLTVKNAQLAKE